MSMRNYWGEFHGPHPTPEEELHASGTRTLAAIVALSAAVASLGVLALWLS